MPTAKQRIVDLLAMGRVANVPSVLSNTFLGAVLAWVLSDAFDLNQHLPYTPDLAGPLLAAVCLYLGGCFLNDWHDAEWDRQHRPERALPSGRSSSLGIGMLAFALLGAGLALSFLQNWRCGIAGLVILAAIAIYTLIHKRSAWGVVMMGLCRALLYPLGFLAQPEPVALPPRTPFSFSLSLFETETKILALIVFGAGLLCYIAGLSLFARHESKGTLQGNRRLLAICLLCVPLLTHSCLLISSWPVLVLYGMAPFVLILLRPLFRSTKSASRKVGLLLAGIPLVDFICMPALAQSMAMPLTSSAPISASPLVVCAVPLVALLLAHLLQRVAPAS